MTAVLLLIRKDLLLYFSKGRSVAMSVVAPILIAAFFGNLFGHLGKPVHIPIAVADLDRSDVSRRITAAMRADEALSVVEVSDAEAMARVRAGTLRAAVVLPSGFGAAAGQAVFGGDAKAQTKLYYDPSQATTLPLVRGIFSQHAMEAISSGARGSLGTIFGGAMPVGSHLGADTGHAAGRPFAVQEFAAGQTNGSGYNTYAHAFAAMSVQFIVMSAIDMGVGLLLMRRMGLWSRLRASPLSRGTLLASRMASGALTAMVLFAAIYAAAFVFFDVRVQGSGAGFVLVISSISLLTATFGMLIAALGRSPETTRGLSILAALLMMMLGGAWIPSFFFTSWLQELSLFTPSRWAIDALDAMTWRGQPFEAALLPTGVMLAFSALFGLLAIWRFDWNE